MQSPESPDRYSMGEDISPTIPHILPQKYYISTNKRRINIRDTLSKYGGERPNIPEPIEPLRKSLGRGSGDYTYSTSASFLREGRLSALEPPSSYHSLHKALPQIPHNIHSFKNPLSQHHWREIGGGRHAISKSFDIGKPTYPTHTYNTRIEVCTIYIYIYI